MSKMTIVRAVEILDPEHREHYEGIEEVNEACRLGRISLSSVKGCTMTLVDQEHNVFRCDKCSELWRFEADGPDENNWEFCPHCGRRIDHVDGVVSGHVMV